MPKTDIVQEAQERLEAAWAQDRENREDAFTDLKFLAGDQWPNAIRQQREAQNRPCLTINRLPQFVNQVANTVRMNPPAIKAIPAGGEATAELAEIYSGLFRQIQYRSNATHVFANAVYNAVACGIGHFRLVTQYVDDDAFDQEILIKRIQDPLSVFWAPGAVEPDRSDAEYCLVSELIGRKEFQKRFPDAAMTDFAAPKDLNAESGLFWANRDAVRVCEYWVKRPHERTIARLASGETIDITQVEERELQRLDIVADRKVRSHKVEHYLLSAAKRCWKGRTNGRGVISRSSPSSAPRRRSKARCFGAA